MDTSHSLESLAESARGAFERLLGRPPRWVAAAPGRVNLIGEHTDYNDGFVLPMAIDRHVVIAADRAPSSARVHSAGLGEWADIAVERPTPSGCPSWSSYVQGVVAGFTARGVAVGPFEAVIGADLPSGGGLSSSAALEVATATLLEAMTGTHLDPLAKALLCQKAEHDFAGVPCGIMDQCASVMGRDGCLLLLDCRSREVRPVPLSDPDAIALIVNSNVKHALTDGGYAARRRQCEQAAGILGVAALRDADERQVRGARVRLGDLLYRRALHVVTENARTVAAADAIGRGDWAEVGRLMAASHASLRDDYEVSCPELDALVELAAEAGGGVIGSRMTGGGFGGCTISLVRRDAAPSVMRHIEEGYVRRTGRAATAFTTQPVDGARLLDTEEPRTK